MELKRYQIFVKDYWRKTSVDVKSLSPELQNFVTNVAKTSKYGTFVLFDGIDRIYEDIPQKNMRNINIQAPIGSITIDDVKKCVDWVEQVNIYKRRIKDKTISEVVLRLVREMISSKFWDETVIYRLFALNEFIEKGNDRTFGQFVAEEETELDNIFTNFSAKSYKHTSKLIEAYSKDKILYYRNRALTKVNPIIDSLTVDELRKIIELHNTEEKVTDSNYSRLVKERVEEIRSLANIASSDDMRDDLFKSFLASADEFGCGNLSLSEMSFDFLSNTGFLMNDKNLLKKQRIINVLKDLEKEITPVEMLTLIFAMNNHSSIFRSCDTERAITVFDSAFSNLDNLTDFIIFISQLVFDYDGTLASYGEWMKAIASGGDDYTMGPIIVLGLMTSEEKSLIKRTISYEQETFRKKYSNWAD